MRIVKLISAVATVALMLAFAASASATSTALCKVHQEPCQAGNQWQELHMTSVGVVKLTNNVATILCLGSLIKGTVGSLGEPQGIQTTSYVFTQCGTNEAHNNCTVTMPVMPNYFVLKTALNVASITETASQIKFTCMGVFGTCVYQYPERTYTLRGAVAGTHHGMLTYGTGGEEEVEEKEGELEEGLLCPPSLTGFNALYEPLEDVFIVS